MDRSRELPLDGIVLTEHRQFEPANSPAREEVRISDPEGSEVETEYGHVLVYGVTEGLKREFDFERVDNPLAEVLAAVEKHGAVAAPAHLTTASWNVCPH